MPRWLSEALGVERADVKSRDLPSLLRGLRTAEWEVIDPNDDRTMFDVRVRSEDEERWKVMARGLSAPSHTFDTGAMADGVYRLKVLASDEPDNPRETAGRDSLVSAPFTVDGTPPRIEDLGVDVREGRMVLRGTAVDAGSPIDRVLVATDYGEWEPAFAADGMFDSPTESFRFEREVTKGEHAVAVQATDGAGNSAVASRIVK